MNTQPNTRIVKETVIASLSQPILPVVIEHTARKVFESFSEKMRSALNGRQERALRLALDGHVVHKSARIFTVRSEDNQHAYLVNLDKSFCTCPDSQKGNACKHRLAAYIFEQSMKACEKPDFPELENPPQDSKPSLLTSDEEALEKARLVLRARSEFLREAIIYAQLPWDNESLPVEILNLDGEVALVRALPRVVNGELIPQFPFPEKQSAAQVIAKCLTAVRIYR